MRKNIMRGLFALLAIVMVAGAAHAQDKKRGDQSKLTRVDLDEAGAAIVTAQDAVRLLRPKWLSPAFGRSASANMLGGGGGATSVMVYIDDMRQPDLESLNRVKGAEIVEVRYLDQNRAIQMRGPGHELGVIEVITVRKRK